MGNGSSAPPRRAIKAGGARARFEPPREMAPAEKGKMQAVRRNQPKGLTACICQLARIVWLTPRGSVQVAIMTSRRTRAQVLSLVRHSAS